MKNVISILFLFFSGMIISQAQEEIVPNSIQNFHLENKTVKYKTVFEFSNTSDSIIIKKLIAFLPTVSSLNNVQFNGSVITAQIENLSVDYKNYGGSWASTWMAITHPMRGKVTIQVKDNKYRVIISDIEFESKSPSVIWQFDSDITKKQKTELTTNKTILKGLEILNKFFSDKFKIANISVDDNW